MAGAAISSNAKARSCFMRKQYALPAKGKG
jgi:hypothetical protein